MVSLCVLSANLAAQQMQPAALRPRPNTSSADSGRLFHEGLEPKGASRAQHAGKGALIGAVSLG